MQRSFLIILLSALVSLTADAAWEVMWTFPGEVTAVYFLDKVGHPEVGYAATSAGTVHRTIDGGKRWKQVGSVWGISSYGHDFAFSDPARGYCASGGRVLVTSDSGNTWSQFSPYVATSVAINPATGLVLLATKTGGYVCSPSGSIVRQFGSSTILRSFASTDSNHMLATCFENFDKFYFSTNGGQTWSMSWFGVEAWQPVGIEGTSIYFAVSEPFQGSNCVYRSDDWGLSWQQVHRFDGSIRLTGTIRASSKALYVQSDVSFYFSTDWGSTWVPFCGPGGKFDYRFYNIEDTIYVGAGSNLWVNRRPLDGPTILPLAIAPPRLDLGAKGCRPHFGEIALNEFTNCVSLPTTFEKVELRGSKQFSFYTDTSKLKYFNATRVVNFGIQYLPNGARYDTAELYIRYKRMGQTIDTIIPIFAELVPTPSFRIEPAQVGLTVKYPCMLHDTLITFLNDPCDSLTITSIEPVGDSDIIIGYAPLPYQLAPDSSFSIRAGTVRSEPGTMFAGIRIRGKAGTSQFDTTIKINIRVLEKVPLALSVPRNIDLGRTPLCAVRYDTATLTNPHCDAVTVDYLGALSPSGELSAVSITLLPVTLKPGEGLRIACEFAPQSSGWKVAPLVIGLSRGQESRDTTIEIRGTGVEVGRLSLDSGLFFDTLTTCDIKIRELSVENESCNDVMLTELYFPVATGSFNYEPKLPITLKRGERKVFDVTFTPRSAENINTKGYMRARTQSQGEFDANFPVNLTVTDPPHSISAYPLSIAASLSICDVIDSFITIRNDALCDTLMLDSLILPVGCTSDFVSRWLAPGDSTSIPLHFTPSDTGVFREAMRIVGRTKYGNADTSINLYFDVHGSKMLFGLQPAALEFEAMPICTSIDTSITISNSGCDTLTISSIASGGQSFIVHNIQAPLFLPPTVSYTFRITAIADTTSGVTQRDERIIVTLEGSERQQIPIPLHISYRYPPQVYLQLAEQAISAPVGGELTIAVDAIIRSPSFIQPQTANVQFMLEYDEDVLAYIDADEGLSSIKGKQFIWHLNIADSLAGKRANLRFQTMLSQNLETSISLANASVAFDPTIEPCPLLVASDGDAAFTVITVCGDSLLSKFLRSGEMPKFTIHPNPASQSIQLQCDRDINGCGIHIYDQLAIVRKHVVIDLRANSGVMIPLDDLPSGIYSVECDYGSNNFIQRVVVER